MSDWRPMDTAPMDGTEVLVYLDFPKRECVVTAQYNVCGEGHWSLVQPEWWGVDECLYPVAWRPTFDAPTDLPASPPSLQK